eukprot:1021312-Prorocentrum_minimum.AAC.8
MYGGPLDSRRSVRVEKPGRPAASFSGLLMANTACFFYSRATNGRHRRVLHQYDRSLFAVNRIKIEIQCFCPGGGVQLQWFDLRSPNLLDLLVAP